MTWALAAAASWFTGDRLVGLFDDPALVPVALLAATVVGAAHGLAPGHGKTLATAYLVGSQARPRHAVMLGVGVAGGHTASTIGVALLWSATVGRGGGDHLTLVTAVLQAVVAVVVLGVGTVLLRHHLRRRRQPPRDGHAGHHHHAHDHLGLGGDRRGLLALGGVGGLLPSPSAFVVFTGGLLTGRVGLALSLVAAFAVGLAGTVTAISLAVLWGRDRVTALAPGRWTARVPLLASIAVTAGGVVLSVGATLRLVALT